MLRALDMRQLSEYAGLYDEDKDDGLVNVRPTGSVAVKNFGEMVRPSPPTLAPAPASPAAHAPAHAPAGHGLAFAIRHVRLRCVQSTAGPAGSNCRGGERATAPFACRLPIACMPFYIPSLTPLYVPSLTPLYIPSLTPLYVPSLARTHLCCPISLLSHTNTHTHSTSLLHPTPQGL